jgi:hypothetical protein
MHSFVGILEEKVPFRRPRCTWNDNITKERRGKGIFWLDNKGSDGGT